MEREEAWDEKLGEIEKVLNLAVNKTTGKSPYKMLMGYITKFHDS